jgi:hypothetical protein
MNQVTVRGIPDDLYRRIKRKAEKDRSSIHRTILDLLSTSTGGPATAGRKRDLGGLAGTWSDAEAEGFASRTEIFSHIDPEIWE